ncbi:cell division cycle 7-related protein kinase-like [Lycorma delicatula]|uniref:cell division cycle 7-related protein kinase-like n=1 Tax=Lycorma delicatula TaxID=130591 RepID=UPI003F5127AD
MIDSKSCNNYERDFCYVINMNTYVSESCSADVGQEIKKEIIENDFIAQSRSQKKINALLEKMPDLNEMFQFHYKVGEGTFSTVYLASLKTSGKGKRQVAIKHLIPTSNPARISQELRCLAHIGGKDNVVGLVKCLRKDDNIVFIMPYLPHEKFSTYMLSMDVSETKLYMKNLLLALKRVHSFNIIHRDVKPNNFLYDRINKRFLLVDFGLAEEVGKNADTNSNESKKRKRSAIDENANGSTSDVVSQPSKKRQALQPLTNTVNSVPMFKKPSTNDASKLMHPISISSIHNNNNSNNNNNNNIISDKIESDVNNIKHIDNELLSSRRQPLSSNSANVQNNISPQKLPRCNLFTDQNKSTNENYVTSSNRLLQKPITPNNKNTVKVFQTLLPSKMNTKSSGSSFLRVQNSQVRPVFTLPLCPSSQNDKKCNCDGKPQVCNVCIVRKRQIAPRAGTPGFRPPEVLLKHPSQTTAVDIWAAGVIFLSIVSGCYPFFRSPDDLTALAEIMSLFGTTAIKKLAFKYGKNLLCNHDKDSENLKDICERLRRRRQEAAELGKKAEETKRCETCGMLDLPIDGCNCKPTDYNSAVGGLFPDTAYDLLNRMLDLDQDTRITATEALNHPFLAD